MINSMESQPQNPEFRINPENFHPWSYNSVIRLEFHFKNHNSWNTTNKHIHVKYIQDASWIQDLETNFP